MTRARKPAANDGMSFLQLMPFPAANPWNWWALAAPQNAVRATAHTLKATLQAWRIGADSMRALVREQQDMLMSMMDASTAPAEDAAPDQAEADQPLANTEADFVTPMLEVTRAYSRAGKAFIVAQRQSMRAFTGAEKPH